MKSILQFCTKLKFAILAMVMVFAMPLIAFAQTASEPQSLEQAAALVPLLWAFYQNSQWLMFGAVVTLIVVFLIRQFVLPKTSLTVRWLPIVSALLGIVAGVGGAIMGGGTVGAALLAVLSGPLASTLWDAVAKYFAPEAPEGVKG